MKAKRHIHKALIALLIQVLCPILTYSQITSYFRTACYNTPQNKPFLETYVTLVGNSISSKEINGMYQNSISVAIKITKDTAVVLMKKYNIIGPAFSNSINAPAFIDVQRYPLENGKYVVQMLLTDNNNLFKKSVQHINQVKIKFNPSELSGSTIQLVETYSKSEKQTNLTKSGFELIPLTVNYFPESMTQLSFYYESYNADTVLGKGKAFIYSYYIENAQNYTKLMDFGSFKKQNAAAVNPLLVKMDISKLVTGNYNLVVELKDENNILQLQEKTFIQRLNRLSQPAAIDSLSIRKQKEINNVAEYFGMCNSLDTLTMYLECLWPIADGVDKERIINQSIKKDRALLKKFAIDFWERRAADTANPLKMWGTYYKSVQEAIALFNCGKQKAYSTDRGRVYLQYGKPNQRSIQNYEANTFPYEIWQYYRTTDESTGKFYSNRKFVFVNRNMGDDCHTLIHSDMPGELNNPRWQFEVTRRNSEGKANFDNNTPAGTESNQFNEIYSNPR